MQQHTSCSPKMGIMMPETCWESTDNKHLTVTSCWFSLSLHNVSVNLYKTKISESWGKCEENIPHINTSLEDGIFCFVLNLSRLLKLSPCTKTAVFKCISAAIKCYCREHIFIDHVDSSQYWTTLTVSIHITLINVDFLLSFFGKWEGIDHETFRTN